MKMVLLSTGATLLISISLAAQSVLSNAEYKKRILEYQERNRLLREQIAQEQAIIIDLKNQIEAANRRIADIRKKRLDALGITADDVAAASEAITALHTDVSSLLGVSDELFQLDSSRILSFKKRLFSLQSQPASRVKDLSGRLTVLAGLIDRCERRLGGLSATTGKDVAANPTAPPKQENRPAESYTVLKVNDKPESLFSIAAKVYGDPMQWPRIYQANKDVIERNFRKYRNGSKSSAYSDPSDLIFPGQVLIIPR